MSEFKKEHNMATCKVCQQLVTKITDHKYDTKNFRYVDEHGKFWNGKTCPACHKLAMKARMQAKRHPEVVPVPDETK